MPNHDLIFARGYHSHKLQTKSNGKLAELFKDLDLHWKRQRLQSRIISVRRLCDDGRLMDFCTFTFQSGKNILVRALHFNDIMMRVKKEEINVVVFSHATRFYLWCRYVLGLTGTTGGINETSEVCVAIMSGKGWWAMAVPLTPAVTANIIRKIETARE